MIVFILIAMSSFCLISLMIMKFFGQQICDFLEIYIIIGALKLFETMKTNINLIVKTDILCI